MTASIPVLHGGRLLGVLPELRHDVPALLLGAHRRLGDVVRLRAPGLPPLVSVAHPQAVRRVLVERADAYRRSPFHDRLKPVLGEGLLTSEPPLWNRQRRLLQPAFHAAALRRHARLMVDEARRFTARWCADPTAVLEANAAFSDFTLAVVSRALFGRDADHAEIGEAVETVRLVLARRMFQILPPPLRWPLPSHLRLRRAAGRLETEVRRILERTDRSDAPAIRRLAEAPSSTPEQIRDEVMTLFLAGHETSAAGLAWAAFLVAQDEALQERLAAEASTLDALDGADPVEGLPLARAVVMESLRLFPTAPWFARRAVADDELGGFLIPAGCVVLVSPYVTQRDPRWWPEPERFRPERFQADAPKPVPQAFFPFGAGPRTCVGLQFALWEMTIALSALLGRARLRLVEPEAVTYQSAVTLRPAPRLLLELRARRR